MLGGNYAFVLKDEQLKLRLAIDTFVDISLHCPADLGAERVDLDWHE